VAETVDYYELLGGDPHASDEDVRRAWKQVALKWHPDRNPGGTEFIFQKIARAYETLCDPRARATYDRSRGIKPPPSTTAPTTSDEVKRAPGVLLMRLSRPLDALLALGIARELGEGLIEIDVERSEIVDGGMIRISMRVDVHCDACNAGVDQYCGRCGSARVLDETYSAWLALRPGTTAGTVLTPSAQLPNVVHPVTFRVNVV